MKSLFPRTSDNILGFTLINFLRKTINVWPKGFTLIELMVVISIIAVLALVGIVFFTSVNSGARDAKRKSDIDSIVHALETNKAPGTVTYNVLNGNMFNANNIPTDPGSNGSAVYCAATSVTTTPPAFPSAWLNTSACPAGYSGPISATVPVSVTSWTVCALLEANVSPKWYCRSNSK